MALGSRTRNGGAFIFDNYKANHVIGSGRDRELYKFLDGTYQGMKHKWRNAKSSNSEDALTWSCFDVLRQIHQEDRSSALKYLWALAYDGKLDCPIGVQSGWVEIGKTYGIEKDLTEVDTSIEGPGALVFIEAKLYSPMSLEKKDRRDDQIAWKLKIGSQLASRAKSGERYYSETGTDFFFILLDLAPPDALRSLNPRASLAGAAKPRIRTGFRSKWLTAYWYQRYKYGRNGSLRPLQNALGVPAETARRLSRNMGWLTWSDVYKAVLRAAITNQAR